MVSAILISTTWSVKKSPVFWLWPLHHPGRHSILLEFFSHEVATSAIEIADWPVQIGHDVKQLHANWFLICGEGATLQ